MKPVIVSYSELDAFRQCNHKHLLGYKERWTAPSTSPALAKGTLWHLVLEDHYKLLMAWQRAGRPRAIDIDGALMPVELALMQRMNFHVFDEGGNYAHPEYGPLIEWMYQGYIEKYGLDSKWQILAVEHGPVVPLPTERGTRSMFRLKLKIDLVVKDLSMTHPKIWIVDHKSGKDLPTEKMLDIDDQFGLYTWAMRQLGKPVFGSIHNAARTQRNKSPMALEDRMMRTMLSRTDRELDRIAIEAYQTAREAYGPLNKGQRAPDSDRCRWRCDFTEPCLHGRKGLDEKQFLIDLGFTQQFERH